MAAADLAGDPCSGSAGGSGGHVASRGICEVAWLVAESREAGRLSGGGAGAPGYRL